MTLLNLVPFIVTATLLTMAPGLDTAIVLRSATTNGARAGALTALGVAAGCLCWGTAAAFGLGAVMQTQPLLFEAMRWAGVLYLGWLGANLLLDPRRAFAFEGTVQNNNPVALASIRRGFLTNILNPKVGLFYLTLLPQFVPHDGGRGDAFELACIHVIIAMMWFLTVSALTGVIARWLRQPTVASQLDRLTGGVFIVFALQLGLSTGLQH
jgi:threonine/homoserine/homoserine lactone efflux protein